MNHGGDRRSGLMGSGTREIIDLADRDIGVSSADLQALTGKPANWVPSRMLDLVERGLVVRCKVRGQKIRWFTKRAAALAWAQAHTPPAERAELSAPPKPGLDGRSSIAKANAVAKRMKAQRPTTTGTVIHAAPVAVEVTTPAHVKVQHIASPPAFGAAAALHVPDEPVIGGWASMGIGRYL